MAIFYKDPAAVLDYAFDWSEWMAEGDGITDCTLTVPDGLTLASESSTSDTVLFWLSGGTAGTDYLITCHIETSQGRIDERTMTVTVRER